MAKFNIQGGVGQISPGQQAVIEKIVRTPPVDETVVETPVEQLDLNDPVIADLNQDYNLEQAQQEPAPVAPPIEEEPVAGAAYTPQQLDALEPDEMYERYEEQRKPVKTRVAEYQAQANQGVDDHQAQLDRGEALRATIELETGAAGATVKTWIPAREAEAIQANPYEDPQSEKDRASAGWQPLKILTDSEGFDAGFIDTSTGAGTVQINPEFTALGVMAVEASLSSDKAFRDSDVDRDGFSDDADPVLAEEAEEEIDADGENRARGNERVGRAVYQEWMRTKAELDGQETDYYLLTKPQPSKKDLEYVGGLLKEAYYESLGGKGNPYLQRETKFNKATGKNETIFQPLEKGLNMMRAAALQAGKPFEGQEIAPRTTPAKQGTAGQKTFEGKVYTKKAVSRLSDQPEGKDLRVIDEAMDNLAAMPSHIDSKAEALMYQNGIVAANQAIQYAKDVVSQLPDRTDPVWEAQDVRNLPQIPPSGPEGAPDFADWMNVGTGQLAKQIGKKRALFIEYKLAQSKHEQAKQRGKPTTTQEEKVAAAYKAFKDFDPGRVFISELNKFIEDLNTIARYANRRNYNTYQVQMGQGRMNMQQNRYNPQSRKNVRYATRQDERPVRIHARATTGWAIDNYMEVASVYLFGTKSLHSAGRIAEFRRHHMDRSADYTRLVGLGKELLGVQLNEEQTLKSREILANTALIKEGEQKMLRMDPRFQQVTTPTYSPELTAELKKHADKGKQEEIPYIMEALMDLAKFDDAYKNDGIFHTKFEPEMDGITNGLSTFGLSVGNRELALRGGVVHIGDKKSMVENQVDGNVRKRMEELMGQKREDLLTDYPDEMHDALRRIADLAIADEKNFLKPPPMTFGYGQELASLIEHVQNTIYTGDNSKDIQEIMGNHDPETVQTYLHSLLQVTLVGALGDTVIFTTRQLRNNNVLAVLTGVPLYHDNAMGFRNWIGGKQSMGLQDTTALEFQRDGKTIKRDVPHYETEFHAAAKRQRGSGEQAGGWGHGQVIPGIVQSYDGNMIAKTASGRSHKRMSEVAQARGHRHSWLPIFDAAKTNLANLDLIREEMNRNWWEGISDTDFVEQMMGSGGWADQAMADTRQHLGSLDADTDVPIHDGKYQGVGALLLDDQVLSGYLASVLPVTADKVTRPDELRATAKELVKQIHVDLKKKGIDFDSTTETLKPRQILQVIETITDHTKLFEANRRLSQRVAKQRKELYKEINPRTISQVDLG